MIRRDHVLHFIINVLATILSILAYRLYPVLLIPALALGLSIGKEYGDSKAQGNFWDWTDIIADVLGIIITIPLLFLM